jgi:hypothetical protein
MREFTFLDHLDKILDHLFDRTLGINSSTLEEIHVLHASKCIIDGVHAALEILRTR